MSESDSSNPDTGIEVMRNKCLTRGISSLKCFSTAFRQFDKDYSRAINFREFQHGLRSYEINMPEDKQQELFNNFDTDRSGTIDFSEFYNRLTPPLQGRRLEIVKQVFSNIDTSGDGLIQTDDLIEKFSSRAKKHPKFISGEWTEKQVIDNLLSAFEQPDSKDGVVSVDEFVNYYACVSAWVEDDCYFESSLKNCWGLE